MKQIDRETPKELDLHLIVDNYATHKHPVVQHWLSRHPRFHTHFTPTSSSWLNLVERFFSKLKHSRAIATRFEKHDANYLALVKLAAARIWMRFMSR